MATARPRRVVVADNDPVWVELVALDLALEGMEVVAVARDGAAAVAACDAHRPDALLIDHRMPPGATGVAVAREVLTRLPGCRVVVFSNDDSPELAAAARAAGAEFVVKTNLRAIRQALR